MKLWKFEIKRRENTVWDFVVPLSLVGVQLLVINYAIASTTLYFGEEPGIPSGLNLFNALFFVSLFLALLVLSILFLTRLQRVIPLLILLIINLIVFIPIIIFDIDYLLDSSIGILFIIISIITYLLLEYLIANLSVLIRFGNNVGKDKIIVSPMRFAIAWAFYGFGIDILRVYAVPLYYPGGAGARSETIFLFDRFYEFIGIPPLAPFFFFIFGVTGYIIEKQKQRMAAK